MLVRAPLSGATKAGLNLVNDQQCAGGACQLARCIKELLRDGADAALALDGFEADGAVFIGECGAQCRDIVERDELDTRHHRHEGFAVLLLFGRRHRAHGAAMKAMIEREELCADLRALAATGSGVESRQLQRSFPRFRAAVRKEGPVHARHLREAGGKFCLAAVEEEIRDVQQLFALFRNGLFDCRMTIAQRVDTDSAQQIEVAVSLVVNKVHAFAADEQDGIALVGLEQELRLSRLHGGQLGRCQFECLHSVVLGHATSTSVPYAIFA